MCRAYLPAGARLYAGFAPTEEPAGAVLLKALDAKPFITAGMRLGEGTGAVAAVALLDLALAPYLGMISFEEANFDAYQPLT